MPADPADPFAHLGPPDAVFGPSGGQTFAGVLLGAGVAAGAFAVALLGAALDVGNRIAAGAIGTGGVVLAAWVWQLRRWRLAVCPGGLLQLRAGGPEELRWADMVEVVETRARVFGQEQTVRVTAVGRSGTIVVNPINTRARRKIFRTILAAAGRHGVPIRVEWQEGD